MVVTHNDVMVENHPKRTIRIEAGHIVTDRTPEPKKEETAVEQTEVEEEPVVLETAVETVEEEAYSEGEVS